jgi:hypothetical protein
MRIASEKARGQKYVSRSEAMRLPEVSSSYQTKAVIHLFTIPQDSVKVT